MITVGLRIRMFIRNALMPLNGNESFDWKNYLTGILIKIRERNSMKNRYNEIIKNLSEKELILNLYVTQILLIGISFVLAIIFFENWSDFFQLFNWGDPAVLLLGGSAGLASGNH